MPSELRNAKRLSEALNAIERRWPESSKSFENESHRPIFVLSAGWGTGSTLLQRLVISSKRAIIWGEPFGHAATIPRLGACLTAINDQWPPDNVFDRDHELEVLSGKWIANLTPPIDYFKVSHRDLIYKWLGTPANIYGVPRWGLKEVRLTIDHARYLQWLFPKAKFLFLYRNLFDCYQSCKGSKWYSVWPDYHCKSPIAFANHWKHLLSGFLKGYKELNGLIIRYEDLVSGQIDLNRISEYLEISSIDEGILDAKIGSRAKDRKPLSYYDRFVLKSVAGDLLKELKYIF